MGSKVSTCTDADVKNYDPAKDGTLTLQKDSKTPNFMQKIKLSCKLPPNVGALRDNTLVGDIYKVDIVIDLAMVISIGIAALLVLILIIGMVIKMRHHKSIEG